MRTSGMTGAIALLAVGCGGDDVAPGEGEEAEAGESEAEGGVEGEGESEAAVPPEGTLRITSGEIAVEPFQENTICLFFELPSDQPVQVVRFSERNRGFAHHFILFARPEGAEPVEGEAPCPDFVESFVSSSPIYPGTRDQAPLPMPEGVALPLQARHPLFLQLHLLNPSEEPVVEELVIDVETGDPDVDYQRAAIVGAANLTFSIPPHAHQHTETQRCRLLSGGEASVFLLTSHAHARSTAFAISVWDGGGSREVYRSEDWADPLVAQFDPPLAVTGLSGGFEFSCTWDNESDRTITDGGSADDEMCIMFGFFYPAGGNTACLAL